MKAIYDILKYQDYFYITFLHEFKGEKKQHSFISVILSLIVNIVCIIIFGINVINLFKRKEPSISYSKIDLFKGINITLNSENLLFSIFLRDKNHLPLNNPSIISINPTYEILYRNNNGILINTIHQLDLVDCSNFYNKYQKIEIEKQYNENDINLHYCFNYSENDLIIGGRYSDDFYGSLSIYISKCQNKSDSNIICESEDNINEKIKDSWLQIFYSTNSINSENFSYPITSDLSSYYIKLDNNLNKQIYTYFGTLDFVSYENILFDNYKKKTISKIDHINNDVISNNKNENQILSTIYVCSAMSKEKIERKYLQIQQVGSSVYGIFYIQCVLSYIILYFPQLRLMDIEIINVLFEYKPKYFSYDKKRIDPKFNRRYSNFKHVKFNPIPLKKKKISFASLNFQKNNQKINKKVSIENPSFKKRINTFDIIKINLCWCNKKYQKSIEEMNFLMKQKRKYTDLAESLKIYIVTEKIKELIISKGLAEPDNFTFQKKLLRYDSNYGLRAYEGKINTTIYKTPALLKEQLHFTGINFDNNFQIIKNSSLSINSFANELNNQNII